MKGFGQETIKTISSNFGDDIYGMLKSKFKDLKNKNEGIFTAKLENYLNFTVDRVGNVKTLFYDSTPKNLLDFYEPLNVQEESSGYFDWDEEPQIEFLSTSSIKYFMRDKENVLFIGNGGSGKTMLMKYMFLNCLVEEYKIPIYIELRHLNNYEGTFIDFLYKTVTDNHFDIDREHFLFSLTLDKYLFLLDAFDEVYPEISETLANEIKDFTLKYSSNKYIITSRFSEGFVDWANFSKFQVSPLSLEQTKSLVSKIPVTDKNKTKFIRDLESNLYGKYKSFASSPLLLNIMLLTYESTSKLPDKLNDFYEKAFETLFYSHDLSKNMYERKMKSGLGYSEFKLIFNRVCFMSYVKSNYTFNFNDLISLIDYAKQKEKTTDFRSEDYLEDLQKNLCMIIKEGMDYYFTHRSFQEYFAACFIRTKKDKEQVEIFKLLMKPKKFFFDIENFWYIMYEMQKERFIENIINSNLKPILEMDSSYKDYVKDIYSEFGLIPADDDEGKDDGVVFTHNKNSKYRLSMIFFKDLVKPDYNFLYPISDILSKERIAKSQSLNKKMINQFDLSFAYIPITALLENDEIYSEWLEYSLGKVAKRECMDFKRWFEYYNSSLNNSGEEEDFLSSL